jgi:RNA polymerase sigma-70 factor (ECF subfamily)
MTQPSPTGPPAEFIAHITRAQRALHAFILTLVRHSADADDVLQEANLVLWSKAAEYDPSRDFMPWAFTIARYQAMAHLKKQQRSRVFFDDELLSRLADEAVAEIAETDARRRALGGCLQKLPEPQRALIAQRYEPGGCVNDLAQARSTTPKALSEMLRRIRHSLQLCVERTLRQEAGT